MYEKEGTNANSTVEETQSFDDYQLADVEDTEQIDAVEQTTDEATPEPTEDVEKNKALIGRLNQREQKGYNRGYKEAKEALMQELEPQLNEIREWKLEREATQLASEQKIPLEIAKRLLRAEQGIPSVAKPATEQSEKSNTQQHDDVINSLLQQAPFIQRAYGLDAQELLNNADAETQGKLLRGEIDFVDLAKAQSEGKHVPAPVRSANSGQIQSININQMSKKEFEEFNKKIGSGKRYRFE